VLTSLLNPRGMGYAAQYVQIYSDKSSPSPKCYFLQDNKKVCLGMVVSHEI